MTTPIATKITSAAQIHAAPQNEPMNPSAMPLRIVNPKKVHRSVLAFSVTSSSSLMRPSLRSWPRDYRAAGSVNVNVAPRPGPSLAAVMSPPCACTMCFAIASPRPVPPPLRDREADFAVDRARAQPHGRALPAELHGVVDEVREHLADAFGVGDDIRNCERRVDRQRHAGTLSERSEALRGSREHHRGRHAPTLHA